MSIINMIKINFNKVLFAALVVFSGELAYAQEDLNIISGKWLQFSDAKNSLYHCLADTAYKLLDKRSLDISGINSLPGWQARQDFIRKKLLECTGPFPEKTPLNARVTRTIDKGSFRVEHIVFESLPGFYVTSSLYLPSGIKKKTKLPAIIYCSGHSADGYRSDVYQHVILNLVKKGFIVYAFDPVGQGERLEYYDPASGKSTIGGPTSEHSYPGAQAFLTGSSQAFYMIWDGIRAVDYLLTRKEVDPARIGITGRSGGGTQSAFIAAYDERIYAAAPENYITNYTRLLQTIGPQDAEQNLFNVVSRGLDHPDFLIVRAPKPALMITTTGDMFNIQGVLETEAEVKRIYKAYEKPENFSRTEDDAGHASTKKNREAMYAFFRKHLSNPGDTLDEDVETLSKDELRVTDKGQVSASFNSSQTVFSLNMKRALELEKKMNSLRADPSGLRAKAIGDARRLSGYIEPKSQNKPVFSGRIRRKGYTVEKYLIQGEGGYIIPYLLFVPEDAKPKALIYLHPDGKAADAKEGGNIEAFVLEGYTVLAPDLIGTGETGHGDLHGDAYFNGASHNLLYAAMLTGRSIAGLRAGDIVRLAGILKGAGFSDVCGYAKSDMVSALVHAAVLSDKINSMILSSPYSSFMTIAVHRFYNPFFILTCVPGAIGNYDIPDLEAAFAPRKLVIEDAVDCLGTKTYSDQIERDVQIIRGGYENIKAGNCFKTSANRIAINEIIEFLR